MCSMMTEVRRWCAGLGINASESSASFSPETMLLHLLKMASRRFAANSRLTWRPPVAMALGVLQVEKITLLRIVQGLGFNWRTLLEDELNKVAAETRVNLPSGPTGQSGAPELTDHGGLKRKHPCDGEDAAKQPRNEVDRVAEMRRVLAADSPHEVLGLSQWSEGGDVRKAYRRLALLVHPDKNPEITEATAAFRRVQEAFERLNISS